MKVKSIEKVLKNKFYEWVDTIDDQFVKDLVVENTIITGGCIASMLLGEEVNDFDIYFADTITAEAVAKYYVKKFIEKNHPKGSWGEIRMKVLTIPNRVLVEIKSAGVMSEGGSTGYRFFEQPPASATDITTNEYMDDLFSHVQEDVESDDPYRPVFISQNAITLSNDIQLVIRFTGSPETIHSNYDFVHCMNYWTSRDMKVVTNNDSLLSLLSKELVYKGSKYPICSLVRTRKFIKRGWTINAGQYLKMSWQVSKLNLEDHGVLQDQLIGVDTAYFSELLRSLKGTNLKDVSDTYLAELVDKIF